MREKVIKKGSTPGYFTRQHMLLFVVFIRVKLHLNPSVQTTCDYASKRKDVVYGA